MTRRRFFFQLILLTIILVVAVLAAQLIPAFRESFLFSMVTIGIFFLISTGMFLFGAKTAVSSDKNAFTRVVMLCTFAKIFLALIMVVVYHRMAEPESNLFVIPFFVVYFAYTIFETMFLTKLGKIKAH